MLHRHIVASSIVLRRHRVLLTEIGQACRACGTLFAF
jgi:hypothetical protein